MDQPSAFICASNELPTHFFIVSEVVSCSGATSSNRSRNMEGALIAFGRCCMPTYLVHLVAQSLPHLRPQMHQLVCQKRTCRICLTLARLALCKV